MDRYMKEEMEEEFQYAAVMIVALAAASILFVFIPLAWLIAELYRLANPRPKEGFVFTPEERDAMISASAEIEQLHAEIEGLHEEALEEGCTQRSDGLYDARRPVARSINESIASAEDCLRSAQMERDAILGGVFNRFETWEGTVRVAWALRLIIGAWAVALLVHNQEFTRALPAFFERADTISMIVGIGFAVLPFIGIGVILGLCGYFGIGKIVTSEYEPSPAKLAQQVHSDQPNPAQEGGGAKALLAWMGAAILLGVAPPYMGIFADVELLEKMSPTAKAKGERGSKSRAKGAQGTIQEKCASILKRLRHSRKMAAKDPRKWGKWVKHWEDKASKKSCPIDT